MNKRVTTMWMNYLKIALRHLRRNKGYAAINLVGLTVGLACFLVIALYVHHEFSYDAYHEKKDRIYRLDERNESFPDGSSMLEGWVAPAVEETFPQIEETVRVFDGPPKVRIGEDSFSEVRGYFSEPSIFKVFSFRMIAGNSETALARPRQIVLTESLAERMFGDDNPLGKTVMVRVVRHGEVPAEVSGIMEDVPPTSHFTFDYLISLETRWIGPLEASADESGWTYVLTTEQANIGRLKEGLTAFAHSSRGENWDYMLRPLTDLYFHYWSPNQGDIRYVYGLSAIALLILLIACANYMNLATARAASRFREVGMRKVVGAYRSQLVGQFLVEAVISSVVALPFAFLLAKAALPVFNNLANTSITMPLGDNFLVLGLMTGGLLLTGLLAGSYPALFLSRFKPVEVIRGRFGKNLSAGRVRRGLIVFQFAGSIALIVCTAIVMQQLDHVQQKDLGFNEEQVITMSTPSYTPAKLVKKELLNYPAIRQVSAASGVPGQSSFGGLITSFEKDGRQLEMRRAFVDADFVETLGLKLLAGRDFDAQRPADQTSAVILNETAAKAMGWTVPDSAVGEKIEALDGKTVIGVAEDFHYESLHQSVAPLALENEQRLREIIVRAGPGRSGAALTAMEKTWDELAIHRPFEFTLLEEQINQLYRKEQRAAKIFGIFAGLAVLLACLGLFGLASFMAVRRTKEIGVRKVLGATAANIVMLLSKDFLKLVGIAIVIAAPAAYFTMDQWLQRFAYRIELRPTVFVLTGIAAIIIAFLAVSYQSIKAALTNPAESLRYE